MRDYVTIIIAICMQIILYLPDFEAHCSETIKRDRFNRKAHTVLY